MGFKNQVDHIPRSEIYTRWGFGKIDTHYLAFLGAGKLTIRAINHLNFEVLAHLDIKSKLISI